MRETAKTLAGRVSFQRPPAFSVFTSARTVEYRLLRSPRSICFVGGFGAKGCSEFTENGKNDQNPRPAEKRFQDGTGNSSSDQQQMA